MKTAKYTIKEFNEKYPNDDVCLDRIFKGRYPDGVFCPVCQKITKYYRRIGRKSYACEFCGNEIFPTAGTIFHKSETPLRSWFYAMFLMSQTRCGISAKQLERELGVTYKTAWRMFKQIRSLMSESTKPMRGHIEVDETYIGGKHSGGSTGRGAEGKTPVVGLVHRNEGQVLTSVVKDVKARTIMPIIWNNVPRGTDNTIHTDEFSTYSYVQKLGYSHGIVQHGKGIYAQGINHVNTVEGFWSLVKRGINGVYHAVSPKYLQTYLNEYQFRYNHRMSETPMFGLMLNRVFALAVPKAERLS
jgi:transposase-like protein